MYAGALWLGTQADGGLKRSLRRKERKERAAEQQEGGFYGLDWQARSKSNLETSKWHVGRSYETTTVVKRMAMQSGVVQYEELLSAIEQGLAIGCH